jgi:hypothetical protein
VKRLLVGALKEGKMILDPEVDVEEVGLAKSNDGSLKPVAEGTEGKAEEAETI